jgi:hypothetical protein
MNKRTIGFVAAMLGVALASSGCKKDVDPKYKKAMEDWSKGICECPATKEGPACEREVEKKTNVEHLAPKDVPGGAAWGIYEEGLKSADIDYLETLRTNAGDCRKKWPQ